MEPCLMVFFGPRTYFLLSRIIYSAKYQTHPRAEVVYNFVHSSQFTCSFCDDLDNIWHMI